MRTLRPAGKLEQLTHAMSRYHWNIVGLCEMRWKNFGEMSTDDRYKVYFSGKEGKHEYGVGFLVHKDVVGAVLGCQPVSSRLISIRLRAAPFNITIIQVYAPTSGHDDSEVDHFYQKLQETIDQTPKKDILVVQGDWNAKVGKDAQADCRGDQIFFSATCPGQVACKNPLVLRNFLLVPKYFSNRKSIGQVANTTISLPLNQSCR